MTLKCVAIDDEPLALSVIEEFCKRRDDIELAVFTDEEEAVDYINQNNPGIVFLDIEMNGSNGLDIARKLKKEIGIIFTTAYIKYALDGFNLDAVDFLHKPFSYRRFEEAIEKAKRRLKYSELINKREQIIVKQSYNNVPVILTDIMYVEAMENYSKIFLRDNRTVIAHASLKSLLGLLPKDEFIRIHKSFIIPRSDIKTFTRSVVVLNNGKEIPVGRQYADILF